MLIHLTPGRLVWPAAMIVWGPGFTTAGHRHHCVQLIVAMRGTPYRERKQKKTDGFGSRRPKPSEVFEVGTNSTQQGRQD